jgi:hypothetical protein
MATDDAAKLQVERRKERTKAFYSKGYEPDPNLKTAELRVARALDYIAARIGQIDDKLGELVQLLKERQDSP